MKDRNRTWVPFAMALAPLAWLLFFASYVLRARVALGRWPEPYRPDPWTLGFHFHHVAVLLGWPASLVLAFVSIVAAWLRWPAVVTRGQALMVSVLAVVSAYAAVELARSNPWHFVAWFLD